MLQKMDKFGKNSHGLDECHLLPQFSKNRFSPLYYHYIQALNEPKLVYPTQEALICHNLSDVGASSELGISSVDLKLTTIISVRSLHCLDP